MDNKLEDVTVLLKEEMPLINEQLSTLRNVKATKDDLVFLENRCVAEYVGKYEHEEFQKKIEKMDMSKD